MVVGVVADVARTVLLLDATETVHEVGRAGQGDRSVAVLAAQERPEHVVAVLVDHVELRGVLDLNLGQVVDCGQAPRLGPIGQIAIGQEDHRRLVDERYPCRLDGRIEAVRRGPGGHDGHGRLAVAAVHGHHQIGGLGLGG